jgi:ABC-type protease/lipase transport system fused ATPase/permease subunit
MDWSATSPKAIMAPMSPWLTRPFNGVISCFDIAFLMLVLEVTLLITLPVALLQGCDQMMPSKAVGLLVILATVVTVAIVEHRKVQAFDYARYGAVERLVERVSAGTLLDEQRQPHYRVRVAPGSSMWAAIPARHNLCPA